MLKELIIDNLALLKHIQISFDHGMTCFTGETGAGKSIMLDAIDLALGGKCSPGFVTSENKPLEITALFTAEPNSQAYNWLIENDFFNDFLSTDTTNKNNIIEISLQRKISKKNNSLKSKSFINQQAATLQQVKKLGQYLIYIHGQHEHLNLLKEQNQLKILDGFGGLNSISLDVHLIYKQWLDCKQELNHNLQLQKEYQSKKQLLDFQISELESSNIEPGEWQSINSQHQWLANQQLYVEQLNQVNFILEEGDDSQASITQMLNQLSNIINNIKSDNKSIDNISEFINQALIQCQEAGSELRDFLDNLDTDPESLNKLDQRISELYELARKYKTKPELLSELLTNLQSEIQELNSVEENIADLNIKISKLESDYLSKAKILSTKRKSAANKLSLELTRLLHKLRMSEAELTIVLNQHEDKNPKACGLESCLFLIKTNAGQTMQPLSQGTSGGELSRVALATQVATAQVEGTPSLIFDEVDVGIGGGTAEIVGKLLHKMGLSTQVMCITHLAQVAAQADNHIKVSKKSEQNETITSIELLSDKQRIDELARMIGGLTITKQTLAHAKELLKQAVDAPV